eukprot:5152840-Pleurochrysis_carterae.AAC.1
MCVCRGGEEGSRFGKGQQCEWAKGVEERGKRDDVRKSSDEERGAGRGRAVEASESQEGRRDVESISNPSQTEWAEPRGAVPHHSVRAVESISQPTKTEMTQCELKPLSSTRMAARDSALRERALPSP